ncbi:MAG TPA: acyltransferase [Baekduia sp.]|nr:acyltransferase [Baekduia sp.]
MPSDGESTRRRYAGLDGLRGVGALGVILLHVWIFTYADAGKPAKTATDNIISELRLALPMFFVLSGFLLIQPWLRQSRTGQGPDVWTYLRHRAGRILPGYWAALIGSLIVLWGTGNRMMPPVDHIPLFLVFAQNQDPDSLFLLDPPMWSLGVEVAFYLLLPLFGWLLRRRGMSATRQIVACLVIVAVGAAFNTWAEITDAERIVTASLMSQLPYFGFGMAAAVIWHKRTAPGWLAIPGCALVAADAAWHIQVNAPVEHWVKDVPAGIGFALIIASAPRLLDLAPVRLLGKASYGLYLWHFPVIVWLRINGHWPDGGLVAAYALVTAITGVLATASWLLIEKPAIAWAHRRREPRPAARPTPRSGSEQPPGIGDGVVARPDLVGVLRFGERSE